MNNRGFGLVNVMIAISIMAIISLGMMTLIRNITDSLTYSRAQVDILNQVYEVRAGLANSQACFLNLGSSNRVNLNGGTVFITQPLRHINSGGVLENTALMIPPATGPGAINATAVWISRNPNSQNLATLSIEFSSAGLGAIGNVIRQIPLSVETDATGMITACSAGLLTGGTTGGGGGSRTGASTCDQSPRPTGLGEGFNAFKSTICDNLTYPTGARPDFDCRVLGMREINLGGNFRYPMLTDSCGSGRVPLGNEFANLQSRNDCMALPNYPEGSSFEYDNQITTCVGGNWIMTGAAPASPVQQDNGGAAN